MVEELNCQEELMNEENSHKNLESSDEATQGVIKATQETIRICKERGILTDFLENNADRVVNIMVDLFSQKEAIRIHVAEQRAESRKEYAMEVASRMKEAGDDTAYIAEMLAESEAQVHEWLNDQPV